MSNLTTPVQAVEPQPIEWPDGGDLAELADQLYGDRP